MNTPLKIWSCAGAVGVGVAAVVVTLLASAPDNQLALQSELTASPATQPLGVFAGPTNHHAGDVRAGDMVEHVFHFEFNGAEPLDLAYSDGPCACSLSSTAGHVEAGGSIDVPVAMEVPWKARGAWRQPIALDYNSLDGRVVRLNLEVAANVVTPEGQETEPPKALLAPHLSSASADSSRANGRRGGFASASPGKTTGSWRFTKTARRAMSIGSVWTRMLPNQAARSSSTSSLPWWLPYARGFTARC